MKRFGCLAALTLAGMIIMAQTNGTGETVTTNFEHAIPNIPGKSLVATVVDYAPGGASVSHEHAKSAFIYAYVVSGAIESEVNDGPKRIYRAGESWRVSASLATDIVLDALEQAVYDRCGPTTTGLVHHSDRGTQYLAMRYTDRLAEAGIAPSVGSRGDSYDNAMAESIIGLFKTEV